MFAHESPQPVLTPSGARQQHRVQIALALDDISTRISTAAATEGPPLHAGGSAPGFLWLQPAAVSQTRCCETQLSSRRSVR